MSWTRRSHRQARHVLPLLFRGAPALGREHVHLPGQRGASRTLAHLALLPRKLLKKRTRKECVRWKQWSRSKCVRNMFRGWSTQAWRSPSRLRRTHWLWCCASSAREMEKIHPVQHHRQPVPQPRTTSSITAATRCSPTSKPPTCSTSGTRR